MDIANDIRQLYGANLPAALTCSTTQFGMVGRYLTALLS